MVKKKTIKRKDQEEQYVKKLQLYLNQSNCELLNEVLNLSTCSTQVGVFSAALKLYKKILEKEKEGYEITFRKGDHEIGPLIIL